MKFGICNEMYVGRSVLETIEHAAGLGYDGLELAPFTLAEDPSLLSVDRQKDIARCAADNGVEVFGQHWILAKPDGLHVNRADAATRARTRDFFKKLIEIGVNTGGRLLTLGSPGQRSFDQGDTLEDATARTIELFQELAPEFEAAGVTLALEPLEADFTNFMTRTAEAREIADRIGSDAVGLTLDIHFIRWESGELGSSVRDAFDKAGERLSHLHIQDDNNQACGAGGIDFTEYAEVVKGIEWGGYISFEAFGDFKEGDGERMAAENIAFLKELFA